METIDLDLLRSAYRNGLFPMADPDAGGQIYWYAPERRGIIPLDDFHVPDTLARTVRKRPFTVTADDAFEKVIRACADRESTWISGEIIDLYVQLHRARDAHSVECWEDGKLVGGLYGVSLGGAFFGESMFYRARDASKVALVHLVRQLRHGGFVLLDTQFVTDHLRQFGATEISRREYQQRLAEALDVEASWWPDGDVPAETAARNTPR